MSRQASKRSSKGEVARKTSALCDQFLKALKGCCWRCCCRKKNGKERKRCALSECAVTEMCIYIYILFSFTSKGAQEDDKEKRFNCFQKSYILSCHIPIPPLKTQSKTFFGLQNRYPQKSRRPFDINEKLPPKNLQLFSIHLPT